MGFSAIVDELIMKNVENRMEMLIKSAEKTGYEDELEKVSKEIRRSFRESLKLILDTSS